MLLAAARPWHMHVLLSKAGNIGAGARFGLCPARDAQPACPAANVPGGRRPTSGYRTPAPTPCRACKRSHAPTYIHASYMHARAQAGLEPTHQVLKNARDVGFDNVHDYLVHLVTGETSTARPGRMSCLPACASASPRARQPACPRLCQSTVTD